MNEVVQIYVGLDNGITGTYAFISECKRLLAFGKYPIIETIGYQKTKAKTVKTLNILEMKNLFWDVKNEYCKITGVDLNTTFVYNILIERPMINPKMFKASLSAARFDQAFYDFITIAKYHEDETSVFRVLGYVDSKTWQKEFFPKDHKGKTKLYSIEKSSNLYPKWKKDIESHGDGDSILIAEYIRRENL